MAPGVLPAGVGEPAEQLPLNRAEPGGPVGCPDGVVLVAACVVFGTFAFIAELRCRELALLRLAGMTAGQVRRLVVTEAAVTGVAGSLIGSVAGTAGGSLAGQALVHAGIAPAWFTVG